LLELNGRDVRAFCQETLQRFQLPLICVTRGDRGSLLVSGDETHEHNGFKVKMADAVGAGDAFTAGLVNQVLHGAPLDEANDFANRMGAWVASRSGAMPPAPEGGLRAALAELG
jgi:fructokinase